MPKLKLTNNPDNTLPIWEGELETDVKCADLNLGEAENWIEQPDGTLVLSYVPEVLEEVIDYFTTELVIDNLLETELGETFLRVWPAPSMLDADFLKSALVVYPKIVRMEPGHERLPGGEDRLLFGKIIIKLDDYLLAPPTMFVGNTDWPATDIVFETEHDYMGACFFLNSNTFHTAWENKSKRNIHLLECSLKLDPLFLAK